LVTLVGVIEASNGSAAKLINIDSLMQVMLLFC